MSIKMISVRNSSNIMFTSGCNNKSKHHTNASQGGADFEVPGVVTAVAVGVRVAVAGVSGEVFSKLVFFVITVYSPPESSS
jgi:hypothetical protein